MPLDPFQPIDPTTGQALAPRPQHTDAQVEERLARAEQAFAVHRATSFAQRAQAMRAAADRLDEHTEAYAQLMTREMGKPIAQARAEVSKCAGACRYYAEQAPAFLADEARETPAQKSYVAYQPIGPVLAIMPWNFPLWQVVRFAAPALMAGNVGLLKHAENVPATAQALEDLFREAGFADGVFQTLFVHKDRMEAIVTDPRIKAVTLTGSDKAGRTVAGQAGGVLKKTVLELGGSDAFIVLADADLDRAVEIGLKARMQNNGQSCIAAKRFILEAPIAAEYTRCYVEAAEAMTIGDPADEAVDLGPMAREDLRDSLHEQVQQALAQGAEVLTGGRPLDRPGFYYAPTVLGNIEPGMVPFEEELFGPVASLIVARDADHAVDLANGVRFGLGGAVFTQDLEKGEAIARRLDCGAAFVNDLVKSHQNVPFGGVKDSGYGRELGREGIREFVNVKTVWIA